jgi:hypothetical protein
MTNRLILSRILMRPTLIQPQVAGNSSYGRPMPRLDRGPGNRPAKTLGLDIPDRLLALTDEVIE